MGDVSDPDHPKLKKESMKYFVFTMFTISTALFTFNACSGPTRQVMCPNFGVEFILPSNNAGESGADYILTDSNGNKILIPKSQCFQIISPVKAENITTPHTPKGMLVDN